MNQMTRTLAFVIAASASVIGAVVAHVVTRPPAVEGYSDIGQPFFPDFTEPTKATAIRVAAWNPRTSRVEEFEVRQENGQWRIPSHYNYPADAQDQLAKAAASAVGILRGSLVSESADTHERFGVVDPLDSSSLQGAGQTGTRITLYQGDEVLADFIIGKRQGQADESPEETAANDDGSGKQQKSGRFYVRRPDESRVYLAEVKIDVSTRFRDWIKKDLLELTQFDLRKIVVNQYSIEVRGQDLVQVPGDVSELTRESSSDPWKLTGLDESKEKLKTGVVSAMARALDELQIVGIRRKPEPLIRFFRDGILTDTLQIIQVVQDLQKNGFYFDGQHLYSSQGEVHAGTKDGVVYTLRFGEVFTGSDLEVEVGQSEAQAEAAEKAKETSEAPPASQDLNPNAPADSTEGKSDSSETTPADSEGDKANESSGSVGDKEKAGKRSRYVIVEATFDPSLLGPPPTEPVRPTPPEGVQPASQPPAEGKDTPTDPNAPKQSGDSPAPTPDTKETPADAAPPTTRSPSEGAPVGDKPCDDDADAPANAPTTTADDSAAPAPAAPPADAKPTSPPAEDAGAPAATNAPTAANPEAAPAADADAPPRQKTPQELYEEALKKYEEELEAYKSKQEDYDKRLKEGQKRVEELNKRFAEWYYVISADLFEDLRVSRAQLVEPIAPPAESKETTPTATPESAPPAPATQPSEPKETKQPPEEKQTKESPETKDAPVESKDAPAEAAPTPPAPKESPTDSQEPTAASPEQPSGAAPGTPAEPLEAPASN